MQANDQSERHEDQVGISEESQNTYKRDSVDVRSLFAEISNDMPATVALLREVLQELASDGVFEIRDKTGLTVRRRGV